VENIQCEDSSTHSNQSGSVQMPNSPVRLQKRKLEAETDNATPASIKKSKIYSNGDHKI
ncbi:hypothetical protein ILUMI_14672, partial [Ignelater luminosus]